jgi:hypothetical protein
MIRLITFRNFPLLDLQIERAYRRRCNDGEKDYAFVETIDDELLWLVREAQARRRNNKDWLRELARQIDALSAKDRKRTSASRRRTVVMAANVVSGPRTPQRSRKAG